MEASRDRELKLAEKYVAYGDMLFRIAYSSLLSKEDAEDAVQEVFTKYLKKAPSFKGEEHERAWFIRVTVNQCHDIQRRQKVRGYTPLHEMVERPILDEDPDSILEEVLGLPESYKTAILLHYFEGYSVEEIALILKITKSAVKMRLLRGRELLKKEISKEGSNHV